MAKQTRMIGLNNRIIAGVQLAILGLAIYWLARAAITFLAPESAWKTPDIATTTMTTVAVADPSQFDFTFDPFHRDAPEAPALDIGGDAPETTLNLKLYGIVAGPKGSAVLKTPDNKQAAYAIDDEIISGVFLKAVTPKYIVLSQSGRLERLTYENNEVSVLKPVPQDVITTGQRNYTVTELVSSVNFAPETVNGRVLGYKISSKRAGFDLSDVGFQNGDIVTRIGNIDMTKKTVDWPQLMTSLQRSQSASVTVMRNGKKMTVKVGNL